MGPNRGAQERERAAARAAQGPSVEGTQDCNALAAGNGPDRHKGGGGRRSGPGLFGVSKEQVTFHDSAGRANYTLVCGATAPSNFDPNDDSIMAAWGGAETVPIATPRYNWRSGPVGLALIRVPTSLFKCLAVVEEINEEKNRRLDFAREQY
jgi:hypothetical protein